MKISYQQLIQYLTKSTNIESVATALNKMGVEVEKQNITDDGDTVFEVEITPNRPDLYSYIGLTREVAAGLDGPIALKLPTIKNSYKKASVERIENKLQEPAQCSRYFLRTITGVKIAESPESIKAQLEKNDIRAINNIVDLVNLVMLETGQPMHAADADKIAVGICLRNPNEKEKIHCLDGETRDLDEKDILICDSDDKHFALGGVMGADACQISDATKNIVIECALFDFISVRRTSKRINLKTDSARRFELGIDPTQLVFSLDRLTDLIIEHAGGEVAQTYSYDSYEYMAKQLSLSKAKLHAYLAVELTDKFVAKTFESLGFNDVKIDATTISVTVPTWRLHDVKYDVCLIEELAKVHGYDNIPSTQPQTTLGFSEHDAWLQCRRITESFFTHQGFNQVINFGFIDEEYQTEHAVFLERPLNKNYAVMRTSQLTGLLTNYQYNVDFGQQDIKLFEIGRCYFHKDGQLIEKTLVSGLSSGLQHPETWKDKSHPVDFYDIKSLLVAYFQEFGMVSANFKFTDDDHVRCMIHYAEHQLGYINFETPFVFELDLDCIQRCSQLGPARYQQPRKYPSITRDISLICEQSFASDNLVQTIREVGGKWVKAVKLFDVYSGKGVPSGQVSLAFSIEFNSPEKTLTNEALNPVLERIISTISQTYSVQIRS